jgi:hypothetical protein
MFPRYAMKQIRSGDPDSLSGRLDRVFIMSVVLTHGWTVRSSSK